VGGRQQAGKKGSSRIGKDGEEEEGKSNGSSRKHPTGNGGKKNVSVGRCGKSVDGRTVESVAKKNPGEPKKKPKKKKSWAAGGSQGGGDMNRQRVARHKKPFDREEG